MTLSRFSTALMAGAMLAVAPLTPSVAEVDTAAMSAEERADFEAARAAILGMAGDYRVSFDMRETTSWHADYTPLEEKMSGGFESVRVLEDAGDHIVLQHLLIVGSQDNPMVVKHWRQDWTYEPADYLSYAGNGRWDLVAVPEAEREGVWSQTVWQVDDSPRYGGIGHWTSEGGVPRWESNWSWRPLARRDAIRDPIYDRYLAINRHSPAPVGWIHWQDNLKMGEEDGETFPVVQEIVLNTYATTEDYDPAPADAYWANTETYWAAVRQAWDEAIRADNGITLTEEPNMGNTHAATLYGLGEAINAGDQDVDEAIAEARALILGGAGD